MSPRVAFWSLGFVLGVVLAALVPENLFPGVRPTAMAFALIGLGMLGELIELRRRRAQAGLRRPTRLRAPDGGIELAHLRSVERLANVVDPRLARFTGRSRGATAVLATEPDRDDPGPLLGTCCLVSMFVGHDSRGWSDEEIARSHEALERAGAWLEGEAARWRAALNVEILDTHFVIQDDEADEVEIAFAQEGDEVGPLEARATEKALRAATKVAVGAGFDDAAELVRWVEQHVEADAVVWLLHPRRRGRSLAVSRAESLLGGVGLAVCYCREASFPEPLKGEARTDPVTIVHELLHLFGATDKYGQSLDNFAPGSVSSRDVMRLSEERLSRLRVDALTAFEVGWTARVEPETTTTAPRRRALRRSSEEYGEGGCIGDESR